MNVVILTGNIASIYDNTDNVKITIADNYKDRTDFIAVTVFGTSANFARQYLKIGDHISIQGRVTTYKDNIGRTIMSIVANTVSFEGYKKYKDDTITAAVEYRKSDEGEGFNAFTDVKDDETDLPF